MDYFQPQRLEEAAAILAEKDCLLLAGGTDVFPAHVTKPVTKPVLDLSRVAGLRCISETDEGIVIGAGATWTDLLNAPLPKAFDGLKQAAREVGSIQIQNRATVMGNLCNASPAADGVPPLLVLDAQVRLFSRRGERNVALEDFILGNRKTSRARDEIASAIVIPKSSIGGQSTFLKLGARRYLVISIAMLAARLALDGKGRIAECAVAVGACSPVARRMRRLEQLLRGQDPARPRLGTEVLDGLSPIDDVRATASYRMEAVRELIIRTLRSATS